MSRGRQKVALCQFKVPVISRGGHASYAAMKGRSKHMKVCPQNLIHHSMEFQYLVF